MTNRQEQGNPHDADLPPRRGHDGMHGADQ
jgi:hypothetical protein